MKSEFTSENDKFWVDAPASFSISEICPNPEDVALFQSTEKDFQNNDKFLRIEGVGGKKDRYISKKTLTIWLYRLSLRLIDIKYHSCTLDQNSFFQLSNSLNQYGTWERSPKEIAEFGEEIGILTKTFDNHFFFPLAYVFQFIKTDDNLLYYLLEEETFVLSFLNYLDEELKNPLPTSLQDWLEKLIVSSELTDRQIIIIFQREGWYSGQKQSLESIAQEFGVSKERIRQIEEDARNKIAPNKKPKKHLYEILIFLLLQSKGSVIIEGDNSIVGFVCKLLHIPLDCSLIPHACIIGELKLDWDEIILNSKGRQIPNSDDLLRMLSKKIVLSSGDLTKISQSLFQNNYEHLKKIHLILLSLRAIGKPANFSEVYEKLRELYPQVKISASYVIATLKRLTHRKMVVWSVINGTYSLKEWRYEKPEWS